MIGWPVMNDAASEARNATTEPISRLTPSIHRYAKVLAYNAAARFRIFVQELRDPRLDVPGADRIDANIPLGISQCHRTSQPDYSVLGGAVTGAGYISANGSCDASDGCNVHDGSATRSLNLIDGVETRDTDL